MRARSEKPTTGPGTSHRHECPGPGCRRSPCRRRRTQDVSDILFCLRHHRPQQRRAVRAPAVAVGLGIWAQQERSPATTATCAFFHNFGYKAGILACLQTGATLIHT